MRHLLLLSLLVFLSILSSSLSLPIEDQETLACGQTLTYASKNGKLYVNNTEFNIKGINWFGFETEIFGPHGCWLWNSIDSCFNDLFGFLRKEKFNAVRVPFAVDVIYYNMVSNSYPLTGMRALDIMSKMIDAAGKHGMVVLLDFQKLVHNTPIPELWYDATWTTQKVKDTIKILINWFGNRWNMLGLDIKNEPHGRASWGTNDVSTDWRLASEDFGNYIIANHPRWLVFVEGLEKNAVGQSNSYYCYWGENLMGVRLNPVRVSNPERLVYSPHAYGPTVASMDYHNAPNFPANLDAVWDEHFGFVKGQTGRAVVLGEWGGQCTGKDQQYHDQLSIYLRNRGMASAFYWALNPNSGDTGGILENDWKTPVQRKLDVLARTMPNPTVFC